MVSEVSDFTSNAEEQLEYYARLLRPSRLRTRLFEAVYRGKPKVKTVATLAKTLKLSEKRVLDLGKFLALHDAFEQTSVDGRVAYKKRPKISAQKAKIMALAGNKRKLEGLPTKRKIAVPARWVIKNYARTPAPRHVTIDDIKEFEKARGVRTVPSKLVPPRLPEAVVKAGVASLLGELSPPKDWGGEPNDLFSTNARIGGKRRPIAFAFKGPAVSGKLTPGKMGTNGDQIQRLVNGFSAEVFLIQYEGQIDQSVLDLLKALVTAKAVTSNAALYFGIIDLRDTYRLRIAYPAKFKS